LESLFVDPAEVSAREAYALLLNCVAPRPIAFVSSMSPDGALNLAPFSFFMAGGANPPSVVFSPTANRSSEPKDSLRNVEATREYVINVVTYAMRAGMNETSPEYPYGVSEWDYAGFTQAPSVHVRPPRVLESPLAMECRLFQIVPHGDGPMSASYIIGEVVGFHIAESLLDGATIDPRRVEYIARMSGDWYTRADAPGMFEMPRPPRR
jgi:flavin reductase (DIM6/NTAB) family NADH-FMN oxidoreductase RutF